VIEHAFFFTYDEILPCAASAFGGCGVGLLRLLRWEFAVRLEHQSIG